MKKNVVPLNPKFPWIITLFEFFFRIFVTLSCCLLFLIFMTHPTIHKFIHTVVFENHDNWLKCGRKFFENKYCMYTLVPDNWDNEKKNNLQTTYLYGNPKWKENLFIVTGGPGGAGFYYFNRFNTFSKNKVNVIFTPQRGIYDSPFYIKCKDGVSQSCVDQEKSKLNLKNILPEQSAKDLIHLTKKHFRDSNNHLLGNSYGTYLARLIVKMEPKLYTSLILSNPTYNSIKFNWYLESLDNFLEKCGIECGVLTPNIIKARLTSWGSLFCQGTSPYNKSRLIKDFYSKLQHSSNHHLMQKFIYEYFLHCDRNTLPKVVNTLYNHEAEEFDSSLDSKDSYFLFYYITCTLNPHIYKEHNSNYAQCKYFKEDSILTEREENLYNLVDFKINIPTLITVGGIDPRTNLHVAKEILKDTIDGRLLVFPHLEHSTIPEECNSLVLNQFITNNSLGICLEHKYNVLYSKNNNLLAHDSENSHTVY